MRKLGRHNVNNVLKKIIDVIRKSCKQCMNNYYQENLNQFQQDPKKCWKFLNENLGRGSRNKIKIFNINGDVISDNHISDMFNTHFYKFLKR